MESAIPSSVLIVDDEAHVRLYIRMLLKSMGVQQFIEAGNGREALELFREYSPELTLMDINMPIMDGLKALELMLEHDPEADIVMMTAEATRQAVESAGKLGAQQFIRKDTPREEIQTLLGELFAEFYGGMERA